MKFADDLTFNYFGVLALRYYKQSYHFFPLTWSEDDQVSNVKLFSQAVKTLGMAAEFIFCRKRFFKRDHRKKPISHYTAKQIYLYTNENE